MPVFRRHNLFIKTLIFLPHRKLGHNIPRFHFFFPTYHKHDVTTQTSQVHSCINYKNLLKVKIDIEMFLAEQICQHYSFCDIVCFHAFE